MKACQSCGAPFAPEEIALGLSVILTDLCRVCRALASRIPDVALSLVLASKQATDYDAPIW